jgi:nitric oxide dioxygenase
MNLEINTIQSSYSKLKPISSEVGETYYLTLEQLYPEIKNVFENEDMNKLKKIWIQGFERIIEGLQDLEGVQKYLKQLGSKFHGLNLNETHYAVFGKSLIFCLKTYLKDHWTNELQDQWILLIGWIIDHLIEGAKKSSAPLRLVTPNTQQQESVDLAKTAKQIARNLLHQALEEEVNDELMQAAKKKIDIILAQVLKEESEQLQAHFNLKKKSA